MAEGFSRCRRQAAAHLPDEAAPLVHGDLNLTLLDWHTDGVPPRRLPSGSSDRQPGPDRARMVRSRADCGIILQFKPDGRPTAFSEAKMHRTFVPDEALTPTHAIPADQHSDAHTSRSEFLGTSPIRYELFRSRHEPELYCAVPEDRPAPAFLQSDRWQVAGRINEADPTPLGFDREAARIGVRLNGFYLFVAFSPIPALRSDGANHLRLRPARGARAQSADALPTPLENRTNLSVHHISQGS
jgi:hypothetical protein